MGGRGGVNGGRESSKKTQRTITNMYVEMR